jgi:hypothetical protein
MTATSLYLVLKSDVDLRHSQLVNFKSTISLFLTSKQGIPFTFNCLIRLLTTEGHRSKNTFTFPDSSDVEDEEGYDEFSEDEIGEREQTSSEDGASIESPLAKASAAADPIDLTGDEEPLVFQSNRIDLTGESALEQGRPADIPQDADDVNIGVYAGNYPILVDSDDEDAHFSMDSDGQSEMAEDNISSKNDSHDEAEESELSEEEEAEDAENSDMEDLYESSAMEAMEPSPITSNVRFALATHDNSTVLLSDIRTRVEATQDFADDDDESDFGLAEAGDAGLRALVEDGLLLNSAYSVPGKATNEAGKASTFSSQIPKHISFATSMQNHQDNASVSVQNASEYSRFQAAQTTLRHELKLSDPVARQPSPSDAAMVKGRMPSRESTHIGVCDLGEFGKNAAQTLGEKTGKGDFFEAREVNKAKFIAGNKSGTTAPSFGENFEQNRPQSTTAATNPFERKQYEHVFGASQSSKSSTGPAFSFGESYYPVTSHKASSAINKLSPADIICKTVMHYFRGLLTDTFRLPYPGTMLFPRQPCSWSGSR